LGEMSLSLIHEIRTPLSVITTLASSLQDLLDEPTLERDVMKSHARQIETTAFQVEQILQNLRSLYGNAPPSAPALLSAERLSEEATRLSQKRVKEAGVELRWKLPKDPLQFKGNFVQLTQALVNLIHNACDAVADGREKWVQIDITARGKQVQISVTDSGPGLGQSLHQKVFEPFYSTKASDQNTNLGLGLSLCQRIIQQHGGQIRIDGRCKNTRFVMSLPKQA
ncbi:MAG: sensor histidine kinase, partial [Bdellovibrionia bacterium]